MSNFNFPIIAGIVLVLSTGVVQAGKPWKLIGYGTGKYAERVTFYSNSNVMVNGNEVTVDYYIKSHYDRIQNVGMFVFDCSSWAFLRLGPGQKENFSQISPDSTEDFYANWACRVVK